MVHDYNMCKEMVNCVYHACSQRIRVVIAQGHEMALTVFVNRRFRERTEPLAAVKFWLSHNLTDLLKFPGENKRKFLNETNLLSYCHLSI